jgi:exoribonuclease-2
MFPLPVATDLMSLNPGSPRCAVSVTAVIDEHGVAEEYWVGTSTVVVKHAVSEEDAARMLAEEPSKHEGLTLLMEAARRRGALRLQRGAVNVRTPECNVRVHDVDDGEGFVDADEEVNSYGNHGERSAAAVRRLEAARLDVRVTRGDQNDVSNLVSEAMILCGELIARFGTENNVPLPYRGQNEPKEFTPKVWQEAPPGLCTEVLKRYTMRAANQGVTPRKHAGLGLDAYVQFSSPIRRYTDLLAHYQVKAFLRGDTFRSTRMR